MTASPATSSRAFAIPGLPSGPSSRGRPLPYRRLLRRFSFTSPARGRAQAISIMRNPTAGIINYKRFRPWPLKRWYWRDPAGKRSADHRGLECDASDEVGEAARGLARSRKGVKVRSRTATALLACAARHLRAHSPARDCPDTTSSNAECNRALAAECKMCGNPLSGFGFSAHLLDPSAEGLRGASREARSPLRDRGDAPPLEARADERTT